MRQWRREHRPTDIQRKKSNARTYAQVYQRRGAIPKGPCIIDGCAAKAQNHHPDYDQPCVVIRMCRKHHMEHHRLPGDEQREREKMFLGKQFSRAA